MQNLNQYKSSWIKSLFFSYMNPALTLANELAEKETSLKEEDVYALPADQTAEVVCDKFWKRYNETKSIWKSLISVMGCTVHAQIVLLLLCNLVQYVGPICLDLILQFWSDPSLSEAYGYTLVSILLVALVLRTFVINHGQDYVTKGVAITYTSLYATLYKRLLYIKDYSNDSRIMNFFNTDISFIAELLNTVNDVWVAPLNLIICLVLLYLQVQWCAFIILGMIILVNVLQQTSMGAFFRARLSKQKATDQRTKLLEEFLAGIRILKYYAWEQFAYSRVDKARQKEIKAMSYTLLIRTVNELVTIIIPTLTVLAVLVIYAYAIGNLTVAKVFTVISLFKILQFPLWTFVSTMIKITQVSASLIRVDKFFALASTFNASSTEKIELPRGTVIIKGTFAWETEEAIKAVKEFNDVLTQKFGPSKRAPSPSKDPNSSVSPSRKPSESIADTPNLTTLHNIDLTVEPGKLATIVGRVGSGKSSLLSAIIGEMVKINGEVLYNGAKAFVPQNPWIVNATLRDNILIDKPYDAVRYEHVLGICELKEDLKTFPNYDLTEIGSKGINLSGGQKQRVAIARAVYSDADIYIFDDCLSALDLNVATNILSNVIMKELSNKTRILVTNNMRSTINADQIIVMKDGRILAQGTYRILIDTCDEFNDLSVSSSNGMAYNTQEMSPCGTIGKETDKTKAIKPPKKKEECKNKGTLVEQEKAESGRIKWRNYLLVLKSSNLFSIILCFLVFPLEQAACIMTEWWVGVWAEEKLGQIDRFYVPIYAGLAGFHGLILVLRGLLYIYFIMNLTRRTQMDMVRTILKAPLRWFDKTPVGRIINRLCKDQANVDNDLVWLLQICFRMTLQLLGALILFGIVTYYFFIVVVVILLLYMYYYSSYIQAASDIRRIEAITRSPIVSQFEETRDGLPTIHAYGYEEALNKRMIKRVNNCISAYLMSRRCNQWLNLRIDLLTSLVVACVFYLAVYARDELGTNASIVGLSLSQALNIGSTITMLLMFIGNLDTRMSSIERIYEYINLEAQENDFEDPKPANDSWPESGTIRINKLSLRYDKDLPYVIRDLSIDIDSKEKIGIVGRTGSGKSTLTLGMLRIIEYDTEMSEKDASQLAILDRSVDLSQIDLNDNCILIDGQNIAKLGLHILRRNVVLIPQDPILFSGTLESNLDPFSDHTTESKKEMVLVLAKVQLLDKIWKKVQEKGGAKKDIDKTGVKIEEGSSIKGEYKIEMKGQDASSINEIDCNILGNVPQNQIDDLLTYEVAEKGGNFSVGERQLLCIARAILRHPKVLIMDEATASLDEATDQIIQRMIETEFKNAFIASLTLIKTIIRYDRILVLKKGKVVEVGTPLDLLNKEDGTFRNMVLKAGPAELESMKQIAVCRKSTDQ